VYFMSTACGHLKGGGSVSFGRMWIEGVKNLILLWTSYMDDPLGITYRNVNAFVERRLQDDQWPFTRVPGNTSYMQSKPMIHSSSLASKIRSMQAE